MLLLTSSLKKLSNLRVVLTVSASLKSFLLGWPGIGKIGFTTVPLEGEEATTGVTGLIRRVESGPLTLWIVKLEWPVLGDRSLKSSAESSSSLKDLIVMSKLSSS